MGYKCKDVTRRPGSCNYRAIEVALVKGHGTAGNGDPVGVLTVDNNWETLSFVSENMDAIADNMVRVKPMDSERRMHVEESAQLFERNLEPLFTLISATAKDHVLDKLSGSLKKALLLMAMDRYDCDSESICRALGLTKHKLNKELKRCGLLQQDQKAA